MTFREVSVIAVREMLRWWLAGDGLRTVGRRAQVDRKTVRHYVEAAVAAGLKRGDSEDKLTDEFLGAVVEAVKAGRPSAFRGGSAEDPHVDGTVWSAALWSARIVVEEAGTAGDIFDALVLRGLAAIGDTDLDTPFREALRGRKHFSRALRAILCVDDVLETGLGEVVASAFAARGILVGYSNEELRDACRAGINVGSRSGSSLKCLSSARR